MKLLKSFWALLGDDRLGLFLAGVCIAGAAQEFGKGEYQSAVMSLALAAVIGGFAWRDIGKDREVKF